jgi:uncharacterized heparinase superfamily protein
VSDAAATHSTRMRPRTAALPSSVRTAPRGVGLRLADHLFRTRLYGLTLGGKGPAGLSHRLAVRWPGDAVLGAALVAGEYRLAGITLRGAPFRAPGAVSAAFLGELHGFAWLTDLAALGDSGAGDVARTLLRDWLDRHDRWEPIAWRADVLGSRLVAWIAYFDEFVGGDPLDEALRRRLLASMVRQATHLARVVAWEVEGAARLRALKGLVFATLALGFAARRVEKALALLEHELPLQIHADGGHRERSPAVQLTVLQDLVDIRTALRIAQLPPPAGLQSAIDRLAPMLRFFRHGDGKLAQFNGTSEAFGPELDLVLARAEAKGKAPTGAPHTGFQRLHAGKTLVLVDAGPPTARGPESIGHAGTLAFEMSCGRERLVVNCGAYQGPSQDWTRAARATAAHSTVVVADTNSAELRPDGSLGRRPEEVACEREDEETGHWMAASHDGYRARYGLIHSRRLFLSADGDDLRGEDRLEGRAGESFTVRFHLHPAAQVSLINDGAAALLRLPSGIGWRVRAEGAQLALAESVYLGAGEIRKTQQLVLSGHVGSQGALVRWAIRRETKKQAETGS